MRPRSSAPGIILTATLVTTLAACGSESIGDGASAGAEPTQAAATTTEPPPRSETTEPRSTEAPPTAPAPDEPDQAVPRAPAPPLEEPTGLLVDGIEPLGDGNPRVARPRSPAATTATGWAPKSCSTCPSHLVSASTVRERSAGTSAVTASSSCRGGERTNSRRPTSGPPSCSTRDGTSWRPTLTRSAATPSAASTSRPHHNVSQSAASWPTARSASAMGSRVGSGSSTRTTPNRWCSGPASQAMNGATSSMASSPHSKSARRSTTPATAGIRSSTAGSSPRAWRAISTGHFCSATRS